MKPDVTTPGMAPQPFFKNEIVRFGQMNFRDLFRDRMLKGRGVGNELDLVAQLVEFFTIGLHGGAVENEFLFVKRDRIMAVVAEIQRVFCEVDDTVLRQCGVGMEQLVRNPGLLFLGMVNEARIHQ